MENKFVIDGTYDFNCIADDARPVCCDTVPFLIQWDHETVMEMGKLFYEENPSEVDDCGIVDALQESMTEDLVEGIREEMQEELDEDEEIDEDEVYSRAQEQAWQYLYTWPDELVDECITYYCTQAGIYQDDEE